MRIQKLTPKYLIETKNLIDSCFRNKIRLDGLEDSILNPEKETYLLFSDGEELIATVGIRENNRVCWLCSKYKRQGKARLLMEYILNSHENVYLFVKQDNISAITLYKSLGFIVTGTKDNSFKMEM